MVGRTKRWRERLIWMSREVKVEFFVTTRKWKRQLFGLKLSAFLRSNSRSHFWTKNPFNNFTLSFFVFKWFIRGLFSTSLSFKQFTVKTVLHNSCCSLDLNPGPHVSEATSANYSLQSFPLLNHSIILDREMFTSPGGFLHGVTTDTYLSVQPY